MVSSEVASSPSPPPLGTLIDNDSLELVEVLGYGGYGVVYRAVDAYSSEPISYAVKCLPHSPKRNASRQRQLHLREITLHQLASAHPNVVTLHRVIEDPEYTYIVMDYCEDGDLFSQILHHRRYLGNNELIKEVFLQLLDAVEYCHSLHIYHRDLKPENVLCFDGGMRLAITDFGLATTETVSTEFRTGSVYHMSPECQGGVFAPTRTYSPLFNDIWSLGIILLNLITGRNPWKSAAADDCTFQAYLRDPLHFLPTVLPISEEVNMLLVRTLEVDWRRRITLREMRSAIKGVENFYSPDVLFEDSMARCPGRRVSGQSPRASPRKRRRRRWSPSHSRGRTTRRSCRPGPTPTPRWSSRRNPRPGRPGRTSLFARATIRTAARCRHPRCRRSSPRASSSTRSTRRATPRRTPSSLRRRQYRRSRGRRVRKAPGGTSPRTGVLPCA
ncbi:kinase-like domain-containing protein [Fomitopsis serialis]|uniref:kinase-like domain-containing protein n=1 Tax=Fomitopsis serialis TaxID=139415 RepID=UPI002008711A|nr:kinase-like domain-containing protein [Neoantrodia serialis]KAH9917171.1 kinase-like domain-containing protein [Neoantrodia serialis]